ncbi:MAG: glycosyltransferase family 4 protein [Planctomycetota bacterium JB042]
MRIGVDFRPVLFSRTGIARYVAELVKGLGALGALDLDLRLHGDAFRRELDPVRAARIVRLGRARLYRRRIPGRLQRLLGPLGRTVDRRLDVELFHHTDLAIPPVGAVPTVVTLHDLAFEVDPSFHEPAFRRDVAPRVRAVVERAAKVITPSAETARRLGEFYGVERDRVAIVPHAADHMLAPDDAADEEEVRRLLDAAGVRSPYVLSVGTIEPRKNHLRLLRAFERFAARRPHGLVLVGRWGWLCDDVRAALAPLVAAGRAVHLETLHDRFLPGLYDAAEFSIYPSLYEGFGLPVLEAMARGCPVVTTEGGALPEVAGSAAVACDGSSEEALEAALACVADDPSLRRSLAAKGRARAAEFSWLRSAAAHLDVYREVVRRSGGG